MHIFSKSECIQKDFDETECMHFMIKEGKVFQKCMEIWGEVINLIKKFNSELMYSKKQVIANKKYLKQKKGFNVFVEK